MYEREKRHTELAAREAKLQTWTLRQLGECLAEVARKANRYEELIEQFIQ